MHISIIYSISYHIYIISGIWYNTTFPGIVYTCTLYWYIIIYRLYHTAPHRHVFHAPRDVGSFNLDSTINSSNNFLKKRRTRRGGNKINIAKHEFYCELVSVRRTVCSFCLARVFLLAKYHILRIILFACLHSLRRIGWMYILVYEAFVVHSKCRRPRWLGRLSSRRLTSISEIREFNSHRVNILVGTFFLQLIISGKRESVS